MHSLKDPGLRIGELAELAATTPRAIRHYHDRGLLGEPDRDESGYRRYGPQHLVRLIRIRRLRSLDMPLEEISANLGTEPFVSEMAGALRSWAHDIEREIDRLAGLRAHVLDVAASGSLSDPAAAWTAALRRHDLLDPAVGLPQGEQDAAQLIDALHPQGIQGAIDQMAELVAEPAVRRRLGELLRRLQALPDDASDEVVDALASEYAAALPTPASPPPPIDPGVMVRLLKEDLSPVKFRFARRVRELLDERRADV
jgi:DNA-binding transcriptional MerR regulator